jgi:hypothetical protein
MFNVSMNRVLKKKNRVEQSPGQFVIFLDNKFPDFFSQVDFLFSSGFLSGADVTVVAKFYYSSAKSLIDAQKRLGFKLMFFSTLASIPSVPAGAVVLYPYNGQSNSRMMLNRDCVHVFVGHGDSNKKASINPLLRTYDNILVTGDLARQRLLDQLILGQSDVSKVISLGKTLIDVHQSVRFRYASSRDGGTLVYLPTWEGGIEAENYCSIGEPSAAELIIGLAAKLGAKVVTIDIHPNLGTRRPVYLNRLAAQIKSFVAAGLKVQLVKSDTKTVSVSKLQGMLASGEISIAPETIDGCYAVVDVSAVEGVLAAAGMPTVVAWKTDAPLFTSEAYWKIRNRQVVRLNSVGAVERAVAHADTPADKQEQQAFVDAMFGYEHPSLRDTAPAEQAQWLHKALFAAKALQKPFVVSAED